MATDRREFTQLFLCNIPVFCRYAQNTVRPCSCGDQAVTHRHTHTHTPTPTHTHKKTTITLRLHAQVNNNYMIIYIYMYMMAHRKWPKF